MMHRMPRMLRAHTLILALSAVLAAIVLSCCAYGAEVSVVLDLPRLEVVQGEDGSAQFECAGAQRLNEAGEPDVPWYPVTVLVPPGASVETVQVFLDGARYEVVDGQWRVDPMPAAVTNRAGRQEAGWPRGRRIENGHDVDIYTADAEWPAHNVRLTGAGELRGW
ncbi:MAG: hypothetical protein JW889_00915, partial [Verrucomicrobia bacterium]|nr:hypothetical protein [Verrucomicrobiota bacterium]